MFCSCGNQVPKAKSLRAKKANAIACTPFVSVVLVFVVVVLLSSDLYYENSSELNAHQSLVVVFFFFFEEICAQPNMRVLFIYLLCVLCGQQ